MDHGQRLPSRQAALSEALRRIQKDRRRITQDEAVDLMLRELERRGFQPTPSDTRAAITFHRGPGWLVRHPIHAYRHGWRVWPWGRG